MRLAIFGTGYVGLVSSVCFAELGHDVVGVDKNPEVVARLRNGTPTIYEPELQTLFASCLEAGRLKFTTRASDAVQHAEIVFLCVGTPSRSDGSADLSQIEEATRSIAPLLDGYKLIVEKSTVPVDTAERIRRIVRQFAVPGQPFDVASNPEFLREGSAIRDFRRPDRIVVGADTERARALLLELYGAGFNCPIIVTDVKTAELIKHTANAFLATKISFINMVSDLCERVGIDVAAVTRGIGSDPRIGDRFLDAGLGYAGPCLPKDIKALIKLADDTGADFGLLRDVEQINQSRTDRLLKKIERALSTPRGRVIGVLGVAFKPNTDDVRGAPSLEVIPALLGAGAALQVYDPRALRNLRRFCPPGGQLRYATSARDAARSADALVILTDWEEFRRLELAKLRTIMRSPIVIDGRNLFNPVEMQAMGFAYYTLGRGDVTGSRRLVEVSAVS